MLGFPYTDADVIGLLQSDKNEVSPDFLKDNNLLNSGTFEVAEFIFLNIIPEHQQEISDAANYSDDSGGIEAASARADEKALSILKAKGVIL